jgi:TetR/AcrR family transcriptional repressor of nem operon
MARGRAGVRYKPDHKEATRERIVARSARRFRADGYAAASVNDVMNDAGLTVGGFYAHFASKQELFAAAITQAAGQTLSDRSAVAATDPVSWVRGFVRSYLSQEHLADIAGGCPLAALGGEVARAGDGARGAYRDSVGCFAEALAAHLEGPETRRREVARAVMSMCVGALTLARGGLDAAAAEALFAACSHAAEDLVRSVTASAANASPAGPDGR